MSKTADDTQVYLYWSSKYQIFASNTGVKCFKNDNERRNIHFSFIKLQSRNAICFDANHFGSFWLISREQSHHAKGRERNKIACWTEFFCSCTHETSTFQLVHHWQSSIPRRKIISEMQQNLKMKPDYGKHKKKLIKKLSKEKKRLKEESERGNWIKSAKLRSHLWLERKVQFYANRASCPYLSIRTRQDCQCNQALEFEARYAGASWTNAHLTLKVLKEFSSKIIRFRKKSNLRRIVLCRTQGCTL